MNMELNKIINEKGWVEIDNVTTDLDLINISNEIGQIIYQKNRELIYTLTPSNGKNSIKGTFSSQFGFNSFPLHTDTAFWTVPARYILLKSVNQSKCNTIITHSDSIFNQFNRKEKNDFSRAIFKIKTNLNSFYSSLIFNENNETGLKYDSTCMIPANKSAIAFVSKISQFEFPTQEITWKGNNAIIIDNWKMLHGRKAAIPEEKRELKRIYINKLIK